MLVLQLHRVLIPALLLLNACRTPSGGGESALQATPVNFDFCQVSGLAADPMSSDLWSAQTVQDQLQKLFNEPFMGQTPWSAYTVAYKKLTARRDQERCTGRLRVQDPFLNNMNHLLSDIMTRNYVHILRQCPANAPELPGFCPMVTRIKAENFDALSAALANTGIYLSSHLALSFSAIAYDDNFWDASPYPNTKRDARPWAEIRAARIGYMKSFKPGYDRFNGFLADNISLVATALSEAKMVKGDALNAATGLSRLIPFKATLFGRIRDQAYAAAIRIIETTEPSAHPLIRMKGTRSEVAYGTFQADRVPTALLKPIEKFALDAVAGKTSLSIYRNLLGGKTWEEMMKDPSLKKEIEQQ